MNGNLSIQALKQQNEINQLRKLLDEAYDIISTHLPAYEVWLETAEEILKEE